MCMCKPYPYYYYKPHPNQHHTQPAGIKEIRYLRITSYKIAKMMTLQQLQKDHDKMQADKIASLQERLRGLRTVLIETTPDEAPAYFNASPEEWREVYANAAGEVDEVFKLLEAAKETVAVVVPSRQDIVDALDLKENDVVMHYKRNMDDKQFIPDYCEGVKWLLSVPLEKPELCDFDSRWISADEARGGRSELDDICTTLRVLFEKDVHEMVSMEERAEWRDWIDEQRDPNCTPQHYANGGEGAWTLPKCRNSIDSVVMLVEQTEDTSEVLTHAGFTASARRAERSENRRQQRVEQEMKEAAEMEYIEAKDFIMFWEAIVSDEEIEHAIQAEFQGVNPAELRCPLVLGRVVEAWDPANPTDKVKVHRYRQPAGDMNKGFSPGIQASDNSKWIIDVDRASIVMVRPEFGKVGKGQKVLKLTQKTKKKLCEIPQVGSSFFLVPGKGMIQTASSCWV